MLISEILEKLQKKHDNLNSEDIELLFNIFIKTISNSLKNGKNIDEVLERFPRLKERYKQMGGTLSGGELQMLAIARCLVAKPKL